jgi:hypothetical protein
MFTVPFTIWLLRQADRNDPIGDLAQDHRRSPLRSDLKTRDDIASAIMHKGGCFAAVEAGEDAWRAWRRVCKRDVYLPTVAPTFPAGPLVYFMQAEDTLIKIGFSENFSDRSTSHVASNPTLRLVGFIPFADKKAERYFHLRFRRDRIRGEWFYPSARLLALVRMMPAT